jgi:hypothetical protein
MNPINEIKKVCRLCGSSDNKFEAKRHQCYKCRNALNKYKLIEKNYAKNYYDTHRDEILLQKKEYYERSKLII